MGETGWGIIFVLGIVAAIAVVLVVAIWQIFAVAKTSVNAERELARDGAYRELAQNAVSTQRTIADEQHRIGRELSELRDRLTSIEKMMKEVG